MFGGRPDSKAKDPTYVASVGNKGHCHRYFLIYIIVLKPHNIIYMTSILLLKVSIIKIIKNTMLLFKVHFILMTCDKGFYNVTWIPLGCGH